MLKDVFRSCREKLRNGGIENADFEAQCIIEAVTGFGRAALIAHGDKPVSDEHKQRINSFTKKRLTRYPLQYILGKWSFMGLPLFVGDGVLIPRDDTEVCVGLCLEYLKGKSGAKAVDLCSGSGAIAIALEKLGNADLTAIELSDKAFYFLEKNISLNKSKVTAIKNDILSCHGEFPDNSLDLIVSNPPYIKKSDLRGLQPEVQFEPKMALDGGESGFDFYKAIILGWSRKLKPGGALVFELGENQAEHVAELMKQNGFQGIRTELDFGGCERAIIGIRN